MEFTVNELQWLLAGILRNKNVLDQAVLRVENIHFNAALERGYMTMWHFIRTHAIDNGGKPILLNDLILRSLQFADAGHINIIDRQQIVEVLRIAGSDKTTWTSPESTRWLLDLLHRFLINRVMIPAFKEAITSPNVGDGIEELNRIYGRIQIGQAKSKDPFDSLTTPNLSESPRTPTGVKFFDHITSSNVGSGGLLPGESVLILAPTGGGKTMMAVQMACTSAWRGREAVYMSYEQEVIQGIYPRIYSFCLHKPVEYFTTVKLEDWCNDPDNISKYEYVARILKGRLHIFDMLEEHREGGAAGGVDDIKKYIQDLRDKGHNPKQLHIDWFLPFYQNYIEKHPIPRNMTQPSHMSYLCRKIANLSDELGINIFIYHQLETVSARSKILRVPDQYASAECKSLGYYVPSILTFTHRDKNDIAMCGVPKLRSGKNGMQHIVRMDGEYSRWTIPTNAEISRDGTSFYVKDAGIIPEQTDIREETANVDTEIDEDLKLETEDVDTNLLRTVLG